MPEKMDGSWMWATSARVSPRWGGTHRVLVETVGEPEVGPRFGFRSPTWGRGEDAQLSLSRRGCEFDERWTNLEEKLAESEILQVQGIRKVKGGLIVDCCGIEGFIPISHLAEEWPGHQPRPSAGAGLPGLGR